MSKALVMRLRAHAAYERKFGAKSKRPATCEEAANEMERQALEIMTLKARLSVFERVEALAKTGPVEEIASLPPDELKTIVATMMDDSKAKERLLQALADIETSLNFGAYVAALEEIDDARAWALLRGQPEAFDAIRRARMAVFYPDRG